jgi:hypothetical protein
MDTRVPLWSHPPKNLVLGCDDVHIWRATFVGALAMDGPPCRLSGWLWSEVGLLKSSESYESVGQPK